MREPIKLPPMPDPWDFTRPTVEAYARLAVEQNTAELRAELERERIRLAACGVVALADTPDSAVDARKMHDDYRSASCDDVARRVDECIRLRAECDALRADVERLTTLDVTLDEKTVQFLSQLMR